MLVIVAPGQGAQSPGALRPWLAVDGVADRLRWWSAVAGVDLVHVGTTASADEIRDTAIAQPLLVASGLVAAGALFPNPEAVREAIGAVAGHSVGELTVAALTGTLSPESAMVLVRERGRAMASAAAIEATGMTAVLGGQAAEVLERIAACGLTAANINGAGQVVAAGTTEQLAALAADPPAGARLRSLAVAGAFHTHHMAPAVEHLAGLVAGIPVRHPSAPYLSNSDGAAVLDGADVLRRLINQVSSPVRWDLCMQAMAEMGVTGVIELPPAGTLTGLIRRELPGVETLALKTPDDLSAARQFISKHGYPTPPDDSLAWRLILAPTPGTFEATDLNTGIALQSGSAVGAVVTHGGERAIAVPHGGAIVEWLVEDGDLVSPGQPLARFHPEVVTT